MDGAVSVLEVWYLLGAAVGTVHFNGVQIGVVLLMLLFLALPGRVLQKRHGYSAAMNVIPLAALPGVAGLFGYAVDPTIAWLSVAAVPFLFLWGMVLSTPCAIPEVRR